MLLDLPTRQDFETLQQKLDAVLALLATAKKPAADEFMSLQDAAEYVRFDPRSVEKWVKEGDYDAAGTHIYLQAHRYSGRLRFKRADVEAFGLGVGVLAPSLGGGTPEPVKAAPGAKKTNNKRAVASENVLRKAA